MGDATLVYVAFAIMLIGALPTCLVVGFNNDFAFFRPRTANLIVALGVVVVMIGGLILLSPLYPYVPELIDTTRETISYWRYIAGGS